MQTRTKEPVIIIAGDTISFTKTLPDYPATEGWILHYELRGGAQQISFDSTPSGEQHVILVSAATTANWQPGENYVLVGYAENAGEGQRFQIYYDSLAVKQNLEGAPGDVTVGTHAQRMIVLLETMLEQMALDDITDSTIQGTMIRRERRQEIYNLRAHYKRERDMELARENARNGRPTGRTIKNRILVTFPNPAVGINEFGAGSVTQNTP